MSCPTCGRTCAPVWKPRAPAWSTSKEDSGNRSWKLRHTKVFLRNAWTPGEQLSRQLAPGDHTPEAGKDHLRAGLAAHRQPQVPPGIGVPPCPAFPRRNADYVRFWHAASGISASSLTRRAFPDSSRVGKGRIWTGDAPQTLCPAWQSPLPPPRAAKARNRGQT